MASETVKQWSMAGERDGVSWGGDVWRVGEPSKNDLWEARQIVKRGSTNVRFLYRKVTYSEITEEAVDAL